jgi:hypothetical protein
VAVSVSVTKQTPVRFRMRAPNLPAGKREDIKIALYDFPVTAALASRVDSAKAAQQHLDHLKGPQP